MKKAIWISILLLPILSSCENEEVAGDCGPDIIINDEFGTVISDPFSITSATINGHCLEVELQAGGCNGDSWEARLFGSPVVALSYPPQMGIMISFDDDELCEAAIKRTFSFDLEPLDDISNKITLQLEGWSESLLYTSGVEILGEWDLVNVNGGLAGIDERFEEGEITWTFDAEKVVIVNNANDDTMYSGLASGTYTYDISFENDEHALVVGDQNLGLITAFASDSLIVDQRAADGFQYVWRRN